MCLVTKDPTIHILEEDMIVYKLVKLELDGRYRSYFRFDYYYIENQLHFRDKLIGKIYESINEAEEDRITYADTETIKKFGFRPGYLKEWVVDEKISVFREGFHFCESLERAKKFNADHKDIVKFTVPKGAEVVYDRFGLGVCNKIICTPNK